MRALRVLNILMASTLLSTLLLADIETEQNEVATPTKLIEGTVTDGAGQPIPGILVTVSSPVLGSERIVVTNIKGQYVFASLPAGTYEISAAGDSLLTLRFADLEVRSGRTAEVDFEMATTVFDEVLIVTTSKDSFGEDVVLWCPKFLPNRASQSPLPLGVELLPARAGWRLKPLEGDC